MNKAEETRRLKAKQLRYKKPIVKDLNLWQIREDLSDIMESCDEVEYLAESDEETLLAALDNNEEDIYEFKIAYAELTAECDQLMADLQYNAYIPDCFDDILVAVNAGSYMDGYLGYDEYEQDYYGIDVPSEWLTGPCAKRLKRLTKDRLLDCMGITLKVILSYVGIRYRYDSLQSAFDILKDKNTGILKAAKRINELYDQCFEGQYFNEQTDNAAEFNRLIEQLPKEVWL